MQRWCAESQERVRVRLKWEQSQIGNLGKSKLEILEAEACLWIRWERGRVHTQKDLNHVLNLEADLMELQINGNGNESTVTLQTLCSCSNGKWLSIFLWQISLGPSLLRCAQIYSRCRCEWWYTLGVELMWSVSKNWNLIMKVGSWSIILSHFWRNWKVFALWRKMHYAKIKSKVLFKNIVFIYRLYKIYLCYACAWFSITFLA